MRRIDPIVPVRSFYVKPRIGNVAPPSSLNSGHDAERIRCHRFSAANVDKSLVIGHPHGGRGLR